MTTLGLQTLCDVLPRIQPMDQQQDQEEESREMLDTNIQQFIAAARQHFFGLESEPEETTAAYLPVRTLH